MSTLYLENLSNFFAYRVSQVSSILGLYFEKPCALTTELNNLRGKAASHRNKRFDEYNLRGEKTDVVNLKSNKYTSFGEIMDEVNFTTNIYIIDV